MKDVFKALTSQEFLDKVIDRDKVFDLSASLSYYTALSIAPLLVLTLTSLSFLGGDFKTEFIHQVHDLVGGQAADTITTIAENADQAPGVRDMASIIGTLTLLFSAGLIFGQLRSSLNTIFEVPSATANASNNSLFHTSLDFVKQKILNMGMVLTFVFISLVSLLISSLISLIFTGTAAFVGQIANLVSSLVIFGALFSGIYYFLPEVRISRKVAVTAGIVTAFLFSIGKSLIGYYLGKSAIVSLYGAAGSLIVLLMWVYYSSLIIFISAEVANEIDKRRKKPPSL